MANPDDFATMRFPDKQWAKWPASITYLMSHYIQKNLIKYRKGGEKPILGKSRPIPGFPCRSPPEQSFPPLVLLIIEITLNPSHVTLFLDTNFFSVLCFVLSLILSLEVLRIWKQQMEV